MLSGLITAAPSSRVGRMLSGFTTAIRSSGPPWAPSATGVGWGVGPAAGSGAGCGVGLLSARPGTGIGDGSGAIDTGAGLGSGSADTGAGLGSGAIDTAPGPRCVAGTTPMGATPKPSGIRPTTTATGPGWGVGLLSIRPVSGRTLSGAGIGLGSGMAAETGLASRAATRPTVVSPEAIKERTGRIGVLLYRGCVHGEDGPRRPRGRFSPTRASRARRPLRRTPRRSTRRPR